MAPSGTDVTCPVNEMRFGWAAAIPQMKVGDKWQLAVPAELAYGAEGNRAGAAKVGPNQAIAFEIELLEILPKAAVE